MLKNYSTPVNKNIEIVQSDSLDILPQSENSIEQEQSSNPVTEDSFHYSSLMPTDVTGDKSLDPDEIQIPSQDEEPISAQPDTGLSTGVIISDSVPEPALMTYNITITI